MVIFYFLFGLGVAAFLGSVGACIHMVRKRTLNGLSFVKLLLIAGVGTFLLIMTVPSLQYIVTKDFITVTGTCTIDINSSGRSSTTYFHFIETDERFQFDELPDLTAYGTSIPYSCSVLVTKDLAWEMGYSVSDMETGEVLATHGIE